MFPALAINLYQCYNSVTQVSFAEDAMYCTNCGRQQPNESRFCNYCGANLQASSAARQPVAPNTQIPSQQSQGSLNPSPAPISPMPVQPQAHNGIVCPRCHSTNVNVQVINQVQLKNAHHGCAWWIFVGWWWIPVKWIFFTLPALIVKLLRPKKQRIVNRVHSTAVCQSCGYNWKV